jgi:predicted double-glycine peptidase
MVSSSNGRKLGQVLGGLALGSALLVTAAAHAANPVIRSGGGTFSVKVTSMKEARFRKVIKQQYDFSCGSAALATLLTYHYESPVTEQDIFVKMYEAGDQEKIRKEGFSLLDMKQYLEERGFQANGYRASLDKLTEVGIPAIVLITTRGYRHFVVVKGVSEEEVLVGDPALGVRTYERKEFEELWNGILFVATSGVSVAKNYFNADEDWKVRHKAPFGTALTRQGLATFTMLLPGQNDF